MRQSHGLRAAAGVSGGVLVGSSYQGGFFAGYISYTANGVATHGLIVAPVASGSNGEFFISFKTTSTATSGTQSPFDGLANSNAMNNADHPAAQYCRGLSIGGYTDWYLPARYELDIAYQNLKPTTASNDTLSGINPYSVPERTANRTAIAPAQTSVLAFQSGGAEDFAFGGRNVFWSSTELAADPTQARIIEFNAGLESSIVKREARLGVNVRAFRKFTL
jgi:hypothetical protein